MFKTEAILIHSHKIRDHSTRYIFLTKQYGKISCFYKKNEIIGSPGDILDILIERKDGINILKQASIRTSLYFRNPDYLFIISILQILKIFHECI